MPIQPFAALLHLTDMFCCIRFYFSLILALCTSNRKARMMAAVEEAVLEQSRADDAALKWKAFTDWMARKGKRGYDVLIDGANVGYYKQNYAGAPKHVAFEQIDAILRHCQALGRKPLIVLHQRHTFVQNCPKQYEPMVQQWRDEKVLYSTPNGSNDDWCVRYYNYTENVYFFRLETMCNVLLQKILKCERERESALDDDM